MSQNNRNPITTPKGGVFQDLAIRIKLILRLMGDSRVNPLVKILPIGALAYWIVPDLAPGPIDDALVLWIGTSLFVELCPPDVVQEHMAALKTTSADLHEPAKPVNDEEVVDAEFWEKK
jgi:hypothetical protein